jgi:serine/threonine protein phosphatase PrpC
MRQDAPQTPAVVFGGSIKGDRSEQQDSFRTIWLKAEQAWLLLVTDGMGGHAAGGVASKVAADTFVASFIAARRAEPSLEKVLQLALEEANCQIQAQQQASPELAGMGTTLVAVHIRRDRLCWISVGDSPLWALREGRLSRLNKDHSLRSLVGAAGTSRGNLLLSALNGEPIVEIDCQSQPNTLAPGDSLILASDGLLTLTEEEIVRAVLPRSGAEGMVRALLEQVQYRAKPHQDNCTAIAYTAPMQPSQQTKRSSSGLSRTTAIWMVIAGLALIAILSRLWRI